MYPTDMEESPQQNLKAAEHAYTVQKDWLRRAEKRLRECRAAVAALVKTPSEAA